MQNVRIGIVGTGFARTVQIPSFLKVEGAEIVSVASATIQKAKQTAEEFSIRHFTDNWRETVSYEEVDLVCITTPPVFHKEMTVFAIEQGKHVLCEKPMAMNLQEAFEMFELSKKNKSLLCLIDHELRFLNGRKKAYEMIRANEIGKIRHIRYDFRAPHRGNPELPWNWWYDATQGGGVLGAIVSHIFDSIHWLAGTDISTVFCQLQTHIKQRRDKDGVLHQVTSDDEANLLLRLSDSDFVEDATANISASMVEYPAYQNRMEIFGSKGSLRIEFDGELFIGKPDREEWSRVAVEPNEELEGVKNTGWGTAFLAFAKELIRALREGQTTLHHAATFEDGYKVQLALDAARKSNELGCVVKL